MDNSSKRRVVVTGMSGITPIGSTNADIWSSLMEGRSGTGPITRFDAEGFDTRIAAEVRDFDPRDHMNPKDARRADRFIQLAVAASRAALVDAELTIDNANRERIGVVIGSALGGIETAERELNTLATRGPQRVSPFFIPMYLADMASGYVSIELGAQGPNLATLSACASGAHAIGESAEMIRRGAADVILAGGSEAAVTPGSVAGFSALKALSTRNDEPVTASRPFDATRDGFVVGEGSAVLVLEALEHACARGAQILAEVTGYAATADAFHITQPSPDGGGAAKAMTVAIESAGLSAGDIDYINAHGTSTPFNDRIESTAIAHTFDGANIPPVSSIKALTGHLLGAAGAVEALACVTTLQQQILPPTWHLVSPDPDCPLDYVRNEPRPAAVRHVLSNSLGFGGHNVSIVFSAYNK
ncbi:MAG TPA: beta-ketoacyl-ACP synthase II [Nitrolancea sp.]